MAILTKTEKYVAETYAKYFGRAPGADEIKYYGLKDNGEAEKASVILNNIIAAADAEKTGLDTTEFVNNAFQNLFGRDATTKEMNKYSKVVEKGENLPINSIYKSVVKADKDVYNNKLEVAAKYAELGGKDDFDLSKISKGNLIKDIKTVTKLDDLLAKYEALAGNSNGIPSSFDGKTFFLTEGVDAGKDFIGTNKGDLFVADNTGTKTNATAADTLDGGKGKDTFELYDAAVTATDLPTLKNIENVVIYDNDAAAAGATTDLKKWDTVESVYLVRDKSLVANTYTFGAKTTTVNLVDNSVATKGLTFDAALTSATLGVDNVFNTTIAGAATVTVNGTALKTLTVDASGKKSTVVLEQATDTIETLNITGKADLTLNTLSNIATIKTVDGSKAEGNLTFSNTANMTSIKTGSGNDTVTLAVAVESGETINLGAGNDKLVAGGGTIAAGSTIDGGAGIDSLDAGLVNAGNAGVFASFETLSLTATAADLDLALVNKSTFTTIAIDGAASSTVRSVSTSQSLTVNATAGATTTLSFKNVAGTADAYKINFNADNAAATVDAKNVIINGIESVTVNSAGKATTTKNVIELTDDAAKSLVITGDKAIGVSFDTAGFGSATAATAINGLGVATIDASAATGAVTINTSYVNIAFNGLTIKGGTAADSITLAQKATVGAGAGDDTIVTSGAGGTLTGGAGKDTFDISDSVLLAAGGGGTPPAELTEATGVVKVTITDLTAGDKIIFADKGTEAFNKTKVDVSGASNLDKALDLALADDGSTNGIINWFQFAGNTYIVEDNSDTVGGGATEATAGDIVVKINGLVDLSNSTYVAGTDTLTIA